MRKGAAYYRSGAVVSLVLDPPGIEALVRGTHLYNTRLEWTGRLWNFHCDCPVEFECKHAYAAGLRWLDQCSHTPGPEAAVRQAPARKSFRQQWEPVLAEKIGRPLTAEEAALLGQLSAVYSAMQNQSGILTAYSLNQHGFSATNEPLGMNFWKPAFENWWSRDSPPKDPWALWQYIAYDWQRHGRPIPEAFLPMTDTRGVRGAVEARLVQQELEVWRRALRDAAVLEEAPVKWLGPQPDMRIRIGEDGSAYLEVRSGPSKPWKAPTTHWLNSFEQAQPSSLQRLPETARHLAIAIRFEKRPLRLASKGLLPDEILGAVISHHSAHGAVTLPGGNTFRIEEEPLRIEATPHPQSPNVLSLSLALHDGRLINGKGVLFCQRPEPLYLVEGKIWRGPPPLPSKHLPVAALADPALSDRLTRIGLRADNQIAARIKHVHLRPVLRCRISEPSPQSCLHVELIARSDDPLCSQVWSGETGWQWTNEHPAPRAEQPDIFIQYDLSAANSAGAHFAEFQLRWDSWTSSWSRLVTRTFAEDFSAWRASMPPETQFEVTHELKSLLEPPLRGRIHVSITPSDASGIDWFDVAVSFKVADITLSQDELELLLKARGQWVRLGRRGWQRLEIDQSLDAGNVEELDRIGISVDDDVLRGNRSSHRFHALQLANATSLAKDDQLAARLRERIDSLRATPPPALPAGLRARLRPYQMDGYHFLAHLATNGLGGILADDMGLGKTLQTLAWLLWLRSCQTESRPFRALVVCPKSVVPNWQNEAARFTPDLTTGRLLPEQPPAQSTNILVINYAQLRLRSDELTPVIWDAVILDEGQNIKNPASNTARAARDLQSRHRIVLTGTPIENRLLDLWSLFAFAQPGILGSQASFRRQYRDKEDASARHRLSTRIRPFLLRRTKTQVAADLPARIEEDVLCELEGEQKRLYDAELKRARQLLGKIKSARQFDAERFNVLQSLLRLRQICCDPRLVGYEGRSASRETRQGRPRGAAGSPSQKPQPPGSKIEALLDTIRPLIEEGHRMLVFSQFVTMLELIRDELASRDIGQLMLTGKTENRQELVDRFQQPDGPPVFLLSLKAAGAGLNLTAASYVVLFDPWWNPAVEAQAIDRTHRIGQTANVIAYRLIAKDTVEEKIRLLQKAKAAIAKAVITEESLATVMDLESLREVLS